MGEVVKVNELEFVCFDLYLVPEHLHNESPVCPHCDSTEKGEVLEYPASHKMISTLCQCPDCNEFYLIVESPSLESIKQPLMTRWTVENGIATTK